MHKMNKIKGGPKISEMGYGSIEPPKKKVPPSKEAKAFIHQLVAKHCQETRQNRQNVSLPFHKAFEDLDDIHRLYSMAGKSNNPAVIIAKDKISARIARKQVKQAKLRAEGKLKPKE